MGWHLLFIPVNFVAAGILVFLANWVSATRWRKSGAAHWTERARLFSPLRKGAATNMLITPAAIVVAETGPDWEVDFAWWYLVLWAAGFAGAILGTYPLDKKAFPRFTFGSWLQLVSFSWTLRLALWAAFLSCILLMPDQPGVGMAIVGIGYFLFGIAWSWGLYMTTLRLAGLLKAPDERLRCIVDSTAGRIGSKSPGVWILNVPFALAYAVPTTGKLMFTSRLLTILSDEEISTVCAHELAHLSESKPILIGRIITSLGLYPLIFLRPAIHYGPSLGCFIGGFILLLSFLGKKLSRRMEVRADELAVESQTQKGTYARALEKICQDILAPAVAKSDRRTHPHLYDRMLAAGIQPDYPRPAKPDDLPWQILVYWVFLGITTGAVLGLK
jgi:Zn-dependent protease with chaperone function